MYFRSQILVCKYRSILEREIVPVSVDTSTAQCRSILVQQKYTSIGRYWYDKSVDTGTFFVYQYRSKKMDQYRSILECLICTSIGRYWNFFRVLVSVDTGTFSVYQYRSILERVRVPYQSILVHFLCTSIGRYWNIFCVRWYYN